MNEEAKEEPLAFDKAEFTGAPPTTDAAPECSACRRPVGSTYFTINDAVTCDDCHHLITMQLKEAKGGHAFMRAAGLGLLAAIGGSVAWYAVAKITGMEIGLLAIAVGYLVGKAVRHGSRSLGARRYQVLAMVLTYVSITGSYIPLVMKTLSTQEPDKAAGKVATAAPSAPAPVADEPASSTSSTSAGSSTTPAPAPSLGPLTIVLVFFIALIAPFLAGASNIIGLLLIAIALYEAWKLNKPVPFVVAGPLRTKTAAAPRE